MVARAQPEPTGAPTPSRVQVAPAVVVNVQPLVTSTSKPEFVIASSPSPTQNCFQRGPSGCPSQPIAPRVCDVMPLGTWTPYSSYHQPHGFCGSWRPGFTTVNSAWRGTPMNPSSMSRRTFRRFGLNRSSWSITWTRRARSACASMASASAVDIAIGFSQRTCLPAASAASAIG